MRCDLRRDAVKCRVASLQEKSHRAAPEVYTSQAERRKHPLLGISQSPHTPQKIDHTTTLQRQTHHDIAKSPSRCLPTVSSTGVASPTTQSPTKSASARLLAASSDICTSRSEGRLLNAVTVETSCLVYVSLIICGSVNHLFDETILMQYRNVDSSPPSTSIRNHLPPKEDCAACVRWFTLCQLCQGPSHSCILDRGAEDC
jgi:hypothetical protein